jgi:aerobic-type carbon monoxide dehydrogenase small subunit (CoxS/CutS family)
MIQMIQAYAIDTIINGERVTAAVAPRTTLAAFLRDWGLLGTKVSCQLQVCGACTVLVDGRPTSSCCYLAVDVDGCDVRTVEGLAEDERLVALQRSFLTRFASQCGYCTSGMLMSATALLERVPQPDDATIRHYMDGNICRCTGYVQILEAIKDASGQLEEMGE